MLASALSWVALKVLPASVGSYVAFALAHWGELRAFIETARGIIRKYKAQFPDAPAPSEKEVVDALSKSSGGRITFTPKKVRDWTPEEWRRHWDHGSGGV